MCGILGTIPYTEPSLFKKALLKISHRGPDSFGIWNNGTEISLGHTRLAILDLSVSGEQPMVTSDGQYAIVLNGEIYNFLELRKELIQKGYQFKSESDTEVLLYSFIEWREKCLLKFNGMWAFAIWNNNLKELFIARDRFGKKPLFYTISNRHFAFASEMKALLPFFTTIAPSKDFQWMVKHIMEYESTEKCLIEGIQRFPAGHYGIYKNNELKKYRYWNTLDNLVEVPQKYEEQVGKFADLFLDSCKIRMRSDVPIGTALSGGLDSSAQICAMYEIAKQKVSDRVSPYWQHAFVATFPGTLLDESYYAQKVVDYIGINATFLTIDPASTINKLETYLYYFEEIYITSPIPMIELYGSIKKHGTTVTLDGHGADELFSGYSGSLFEAIPDAGFNKQQINSIFNAYYDIFPIKVSQALIKKNKFFEYIDYYLRRKYDKLIGRIPNSKDHRHKNFKYLDHFNKHLYLLTHDTILPTLLRNYDRYAMANGVEIRMPFMDWRLVAYAMSLKWNSKIRNGYTKSIIRDAMKPYMPKEIVQRKTKIGFNTPILDWMKNELREYFMDTINSIAFNTCLLIDSKKVKKQIENVIFNPNASYSDGELAWKSLSPFLWEKVFIKDFRF